MIVSEETERVLSIFQDPGIEKWRTWKTHARLVAAASFYTRPGATPLCVVSK